MSKKVPRLYEQFRPEHYALTLKIDQAAMTFSGMVTLTGHKTGRPSQRITLHQNALKITSAKIVRSSKNGEESVEVARINHHQSLNEVRLHTDEILYPGSYTISCEFTGTITKNMSGIYPCYYTHNGQEKQLIATQFESHHAREAFPCIDEPEAKATFDLTLFTKEKETVLSNNPIASQTTTGGMLTTTFETTPRMSTYLLAFVTGELHKKTVTTKSGVEVNIWGTVAQPADAFDFALDAATRSIEFFEDYFKVPYPLKKADHVALPDFSSGAMENWGLITYREAVLLLYPDAVSQSTKELIATVIAHETSHQWFGNLVTMQWWDDLWLNESFANLMEYVAVDALYPDWNIWESFVVVEGLSALRRDATAGVQAVKTEVNHPDEISTLFDPSIVYAKGGRLLFMLKNYIGEEAFRNGLQTYFTEHAYKNTEGKDLWAALGKASGLDVAAFMNPWLERSGFPVLTLDHTGEIVTISQQHFLTEPKDADPDRLWSVPLFRIDDSEPRIIDAPQLQFTAPVDSPVFINSEARGHYIVRYKNPNYREELMKQVSVKSLHKVDRLMLLNNGAMLARAGVDTMASTLELLTAYIHEDSEPVWDMISSIIGDARQFVDLDNTLESPIKTLARSVVEEQYERLGWEENAKDSAADQKLRATIIGLGSYGDHTGIIEHGLKLFESYKNDTSCVAAELRGIVFSIAIKKQQEGTLDYLLNLHGATHSSDLQRDIVGAITSTRDTAEAERLLAMVKDSKLVKPQDADRWIFYLLRNRFVRQLTWQWMEHNWNWIEATYHKDKSFDYFPRYAASAVNTREMQQRFLAFFESKMDQPILKRNITIGIAEIAARVDWLERDLAGVQQFFAKR